MARENIKKLKVPIEQGLVTYGSGYEIGPRLRHIANLVHNYIDDEGNAIFPFRAPDVPTPDGVILSFDAENANGTGYWDSDGAHFFVAANQIGGAKPKAIWDMETGDQLPVVGASLGNSAFNPPASFAFAPNITVPTTFVVQQFMPKKAIIDSGGATLIDYSPVFDPDGMTDFNAYPTVCYYHLNRLWLAYNSFVTRRCLVFFTDPLNTDLIRGESFLDIPGRVTAIFRASASDIDLGAQAHLIFATRAGLFVLDGDPTQGNAVFRQMKKDFGIFSPRHVFETSEGAAFLATDNKIYLLPRGATEPVAINGDIREKFRHTTETNFFGYRFPYLYVFENNANRFWLCDLGDLSKEPYWTGPHEGQPGMNGFITNVPTTTDILIPVTNPIQIASMQPTTATQLLRTGYVYEEDTDVVFNRAWFDFQQLGVEYSITFRVFNPQGLQETFTITIPAFTGTTTTDVMYKASVVAQPQLAEVGDFFWMELEGLYLQYLRNWNIEYRVQPRKD